MDGFSGLVATSAATVAFLAVLLDGMALDGGLLSDYWAVCCLGGGALLEVVGCTDSTVVVWTAAVVWDLVGAMLPATWVVCCPPRAGLPGYPFFWLMFLMRAMYWLGKESILGSRLLS